MRRVWKRHRRGPAQLHNQSQTYVCFSQNSRPVNKACEVNQRWLTCKLVSAGPEWQKCGGKKKRKKGETLDERGRMEAGQEGGTPWGTHLIGSLCRNVLRWEPIMGGPEAEPPAPRGRGLFRKLDFTFRSRRKAFVWDGCHLSPPPTFPTDKLPTKSALDIRHGALRVKR